jgi:hypothetical protein
MAVYCLNATVPYFEASAINRQKFPILFAEGMSGLSVWCSHMESERFSVPTLQRVLCHKRI